MKNIVKSLIQNSIYIFSAIIIYLFLTEPCNAQDASKVDSDHYKVVFENDKMRVLHISYGPGEKSVMHSHPEGLGIFITDAQAKFRQPDGKSIDSKFKAGQVVWLEASTHLPQNIGSKRFELYQIEIKPKPKVSQPSEEVDNKHKPQG